MKKLITHIVLLSLFLFYKVNCFSQERFLFDLVTKKERANFGSVHNIYEDSCGIIWMGIFNKGLAYYNGIEVKRFPLPGEEIFASSYDVFHYSASNIYLNYKEHILKFDPISQKEELKIPIDESLRGIGKISSISVSQFDGLQLVWAALEITDASPGTYALLLSINDSPLKMLTTNTYRADGQIVLKSQKDKVVLKNENGLEVVNQNGLLTKQLSPLPLPLGAIKETNFQIDSNENILLFGRFTHKSGNPRALNSWSELFICDIGSNYFDRYKLQGDRTSFFYYNGDSYCTSKGHFELRNEESAFVLDTLSRFSLKNRLVKEYRGIGYFHVRFKSRSGIHFEGGSYGLGKLVLQPEAFDYLPPLSIRSFFEDDLGNIYGSLNWMVRQTKKETFTSIESSSLIKYNPLDKSRSNLSFQVSGEKVVQGGYWYKAEKLGDEVYFNMNKLNLKTLELTPIQTIENGYITLIVQDRYLWKAHWGYPFVHIYDINNNYKQVKKVLIPPFEEQAIEINDAYQRPSDKTIWMGTYGLGVLVFSESGDFLYQIDRSPESKVQLPSNIVSGLYEDNNGDMWLGHGSGISRISPGFKEIKNYTIEQDYPESRLVYTFLPEDDDRYLWIGTSKGIFRFDKEVERFLDFPLHPLMMNIEFNRTAAYKSSNGQFYFGATNTSLPTISFRPQKAIEFYKNLSPQDSKILIKSLKKFDQSSGTLKTNTTGLQELKNIVIEPDERFFEVEFLVTDYRSPLHNYYSYTLEPYDKGWSEVSRLGNKIRYENLPPGNYTLKMRGGLLPDFIDKNERTISITVIPHWYQRKGVILLGIILFILSIILFFKSYMRRQLQTQESIRLRDLNDLKTRLYTNITHEFRTPLTVIMGMNDNIEGHQKEKGLIKRNAKNLLRLINQLLDLSKLDSGKLKLDNIQGDVVPYLQYLTESFYSMASDKRVSLKFSSNINELICDYDEIKLQHVIYNLLSNAIKFTGSGGKVHLELLYNLQELTIIVRDTGIGISKEEIPHIFDRFYQVESRQKTKVSGLTFSGTGIGLALTKELVELMGGRISVESEKSWGSKFVVTLPIKKSVNIGPNRVRIESENKSFDFKDLPIDVDQIHSEKPLILVVEDNSGVVTYIRSILEEDHQIQVAINGQEGIDFAMEQIPDLIISDVMMPIKSGYELAKTLKNDKRTSHIPIIMLTAKSDPTSKITGLETGVEAYISKPFEKQELLLSIRNLLALRNKLQAHYSNVIEGKSVQELSVKHPIEDSFIKEILDYLEDNYSNSDISIQDIAKGVHLGHTQFYRKLKALTGKTPSIYLRDFRIERASEILHTSNFNISEIAYTVGFNDPNYFSRAFKKVKGVTPNEWRSKK